MKLQMQMFLQMIYRIYLLHSKNVDENKSFVDPGYIRTGYVEVVKIIEKMKIIILLKKYATFYTRLNRNSGNSDEEFFIHCRPAGTN